MNFKKLMICTFVLFLTIVFCDFIIHGIILKNLYLETSSLWRPESEMPAYMGHMFLGQFIMAFFLSLIFAQGYRNTGIMEGVRYGLVLGGLEMGKNFIMHSVTPYPVSLTFSWISFGFIELVFIGIIASLVYGKTKK